jgi:hypothetical protein
MPTTLLVESIFSVSLFAILFFYLPLVWLNTVFTLNSSNFTPANVPFYSGIYNSIPNKFVFDTNRYWFFWFVLASDIVMLLQLFVWWPFLVRKVAVGLQRNLATAFLIIFTALTFVLQLAKGLVSFGFAIFACGNITFCRDYNPAIVSGTPNYVFYLFLLFETFVFPVWLGFRLFSVRKIM